MAWPSFIRIVNGRPTIKAGLMRHSITVLAPGAVSSDLSGATQNYSLFGSAQAVLQDVSATDKLQGGIISTETNVSMGIWAYAVPGIQANMVILRPDGREYLIQSIQDVMEAGVILILNCLGLGSNR
jgi:hypothetical protein